MKQLAKPFLAADEVRRQQSTGRITATDQPMGPAMSAFLQFIYQEYCRARLAEMRKARVAA
jgi:hypothetical protein